MLLIDLFACSSLVFLLSALIALVAATRDPEMEGRAYWMCFWWCVASFAIWIVLSIAVLWP